MKRSTGLVGGSPVFDSPCGKQPSLFLQTSEHFFLSLSLSFFIFTAGVVGHPYSIAKESS